VAIAIKTAPKNMKIQSSVIQVNFKAFQFHFKKLQNVGMLQSQKRASRCREIASKAFLPRTSRTSGYKTAAQRTTSKFDHEN
jgi:hypothetical protein